MATDKPLHPSPPSSVPFRVSLDTIQRAVNALLKWKNSKSKTQKPQLLEQDDFMYLVLTLKKIPPKGRTNPYKISLPRPLHSPQDSSELCLIIDDRPKSKLTSDDAKRKIKSENIPISKILKLSKLRSDYRPFEAKRKLCDSYDMFFADKRVVPLLPKLLGKQFFKKKKIPVPVDLTHKNWKEQIGRACSSALLYLRAGTCSVVRVGKVSMEGGEMVENVGAAIDGVVEVIPKKWAGVRSFHLKFSESLALPLYQALPDMKLKIEGVKNNEQGIKDKVGRELPIKEDAQKDEKLGKKKVSKKGRIHEVRYMDSNVDEDELGSDEDGEYFESDKNEDDELGSAEFGGKKRKKGDSMKTGKKRSKKLAKQENVDGGKPKKDGLSLKDGEVSVGRKEKKSGLGKLKDGPKIVKIKKKTLGFPRVDQLGFPYGPSIALRDEVLASTLRRDRSEIFRVIVSHTNTLTRSHSTLLYAIATGVPIDDTYVISSAIDGAASGRRTIVLPFGRVITRIDELSTQRAHIQAIHECQDQFAASLSVMATNLHSLIPDDDDNCDDGDD
ncbi:hypothetical protein F0562_010439 [Nyssa sinensis]|uniref:Ribosomal protein L1 n=1 Tax=Nyssa sinensis TaxID=561372 RepID=A0A5J5A0Y6_9ASTE|nr:hypothetical protein F0562_010439 [Nyssa sinensis]